MKWSFLISSDNDMSEHVTVTAGPYLCFPLAGLQMFEQIQSPTPSLPKQSPSSSSTTSATVTKAIKIIHSFKLRLFFLSLYLLPFYMSWVIVEFPLNAKHRFFTSSLIYSKEQQLLLLISYSKTLGQPFVLSPLTNLPQSISYFLEISMPPTIVASLPTQHLDVPSFLSNITLFQLILTSF